jgi:hypothetical protein
VDTINSISEFLLQAGSQYRIFDMGRRVQPISTELFVDFEHANTPYPYPLQQHALVAVLFWNKSQNDNHYVWFLKLPLDEQGLLMQAPRNQFLELVVTALGNSMQQQPDEEQQSALDHNPLIFKPSEQKLAAFTSQSRLAMNLSASQYMTPALDYLADQSNYQHWQQLGFQGLADIAARLEQGNSLKLVVKAIKSLPAEPFCALCCSLENSEIPSQLAEPLLEILSDALATNNISIAVHALRALSNSSDHTQRQAALKQTFASELIKNQLDIVIIIAARYWSVLNSIETAVNYLEAVVEVSPEQDIFNQLFSDLVAVPHTRRYFLNALRHPERSNKLAQAIAQLIGG